MKPSVMKNLHSFALVTLLLIAFLQYQCSSEEVPPSSSSSNSVNDQGGNVTDSELVVEDYLESLSNEELEKICLDRGFSLAIEGGIMQRQDYLTAARRCLSLEDEMNAIIAAHPELAAELDAEIERMRHHKIQLERERDEILAQKAMLEEQLEKAGVDVGSCMNRSATSTGGIATLDPNDMTLEEVLRHSFTLLYQRVMQDVKVVRKVLDPLVFKPLGSTCQLIWKYSKPTLTTLWVNARAKARDYIAPSQKENATAANTALAS